MRSVASVQKEYLKRRGVKISLEQARDILLGIPYLEPIEGNWDKFRVLDQDKIKEVIEGIAEERKAIEEADGNGAN